MDKKNERVIYSINRMNKHGILTETQRCFYNMTGRVVSPFEISAEEIRSIVNDWRNGELKDTMLANAITTDHLIEMKLLSTVSVPTETNTFVLRETLSVRPTCRGNFKLLTIVFRRNPFQSCEKFMVLVVPWLCVYMIGGESEPERLIRNMLTHEHTTDSDIVRALEELPQQYKYPSILRILLQTKSLIGVTTFKLL